MTPNPSDTASSSSPNPSWPTTVTVELPGHLAHMKRLIRAAYAALREYRWYNPYSYALNFAALRFTTLTLIFSVWPQAWLEWVEEPYFGTPAAPDVPGDALDDTSNDTQDAEHGDEQGLAGVELTVDEPNPPVVIPIPPSPRRLRPRTKTSTTSQRPPVSTASTASTASAPDVRSRYADHAVLMTSLPEPPKAKPATKSAKGKASMKSSKSAAGVQSSDSEISVESVHSIWEVKPPQAPKSCPYTSIDQKRTATSLFLQPYVLKQLLQEAEGAFTQYPHQTVMHVFLGVGYWVRKCLMHRSNMPSCNPDFDYETANYKQLRSYIETWPVFPLLNSKGTEYSDKFLEFWDEATRDASAAAAPLLSQ